MKKVKFFIPAMGRINTKNRDGSEIRLHELSKIWANEGYLIEIYAPERQVEIFKKSVEFQKKVNFTKIKDIVNSESSNIFNILAIYGYRILISLFNKYPKNIDIIYVPSDFLVDLIPAICCKIYNPKAKIIACIFLVAPNPFVGYENMYKKGKYKIPNFRGLIYYLTQRFGFKLLEFFNSKVLVLNQIDFETTRKYFKNVNLVSMGVNYSEYSIEEKNKSKNFDAIYVGRIHPQKGLNDLLEIWNIVVKAMPMASLAIVGGGDLRDIKKLRKKISELSLENNISFLGFKEGDEKIELLHKSKIFIIPSTYESFAMTIIEAMASSLPVCAYDLPVFRLIYGEKLMFAKIGDYKKFSENILMLLSDHSLLEDMSNKCKEFSKNFDWNKISKNELVICEEL
ncbi:glycosyltransferase family 4 protein [Polynucleobacter paneuropaeus]|nr:glycosyltransferase family 4 protein [Polynucleobacter paneuropaeus]QWD09506.1 glycosyltransferase family 4 protein [Polynucleobacter paneuropaeus]